MSEKRTGMRRGEMLNLRWQDIPYDTHSQVVWYRKVYLFMRYKSPLGPSNIVVTQEYSYLQPEGLCNTANKISLTLNETNFNFKVYQLYFNYRWVERLTGRVEHRQASTQSGTIRGQAPTGNGWGFLFSVGGYTSNQGGMLNE
jgi:hypothetical protein